MPAGNQRTPRDDGEERKERGEEGENALREIGSQHLQRAQEIRAGQQTGLDPPS